LLLIELSLAIKDFQNSVSNSLNTIHRVSNLVQRAYDLEGRTFPSNATDEDFDTAADLVSAVEHPDFVRALAEAGFQKDSFAQPVFHQALDDYEGQRSRGDVPRCSPSVVASLVTPTVAPSIASSEAMEPVSQVGTPAPPVQTSPRNSRSGSRNKLKQKLQKRRK
jgi:hypothetical protein